MNTSARPIRLLRLVVNAAIGSLVVLILAGLVLGRIIPLTGRQTLIIGGGSMEPTIPIGSAAIIEPVAPAALSVGDVVTIRVGPKASVFTHRITRQLALGGVPYIETKGDANPRPDGATIPASAVVGRVAFWIPVAGYLLALLSVPIGVVFTLGIGLCLVLAAILLETFEPDAQPEGGAAGRRGRVPPEVVAENAFEGRVARHVAARSARSRPVVRRAL